MVTHLQAFQRTSEESEAIKELKEAQTDKIAELIASPKLGIKREDFDDFLYCFNLLINAKGVLNSTHAVQFYLKDIKQSYVNRETEKTKT